MMLERRLTKSLSDSIKHKHSRSINDLAFYNRKSNGKTFKTIVKFKIKISRCWIQEGKERRGGGVRGNGRVRKPKAESLQGRKEKLKRGGGEYWEMYSFCKILNKMSQKGMERNTVAPPPLYTYGSLFQCSIPIT